MKLNGCKITKPENNTIVHIQMPKILQRIDANHNCYVIENNNDSDIYVVDNDQNIYTTEIPKDVRNNAGKIQMVKYGKDARIAIVDEGPTIELLTTFENSNPEVRKMLNILGFYHNKFFKRLHVDGYFVVVQCGKVYILHTDENFKLGPQYYESEPVSVPDLDLLKPESMFMQVAIASGHSLIEVSNGNRSLTIPLFPRNDLGIVRELITGFKLDV